MADRDSGDFTKASYSVSGRWRGGAVVVRAARTAAHEV
jgi:hypothetical protein